MMPHASILVALLAVNAAAFDENIKDVKTAPAIDLRLAPIAGKLWTLPSIPTTPNFGIPNVPNIDVLQAVQPIQTAETVPHSKVIGLDGKQKDAKGLGAQGNLKNLGGAIGEDEKNAGGAAVGDISAEFFDKMLPQHGAVAAPVVEVAAPRMAKEIEAPDQILRAKGVQATVSFYGSARILSPEAAREKYKATVEQYGRKPGTKEGKDALVAARQAVQLSKYYTIAQELGALVARGGGGKVAVVTGGGPGIMEAANRGAHEAGGPSAGFNIKLPHEQKPNPYITPGLSLDFEYFASREIGMRHLSLGMTFFPGGFGTMDEFFEILTLMQTGKIARRPLVLVGEKTYWDKILDFDQFAKMGLISKDDLKLFKYAETAKDAWNILRQSAK